MRFLSLLPRYIIALVLTVSAYGMYGHLVAPLIEGESGIVLKTPLPFSRPVTDPGEQYRQELTHILPVDGWEQQPCTILETPQARVLFQDHKVLEDGSLELTPLTLVLKPRTGKHDSDSIPPMVLRSPGGARLKFERPLSAEGKMGELQHGQLIGEVQIFRPASSPDKDDSLYLETSNVQLSPERIFTLYECNFRFGQSYGKGKRLTVDLFDPGTAAPGESSSFTGIERIEMGQVRELYLHRTSEQQTVLASPDVATRADVLGDTNRSFLIHCDGPMRFDVLEHTIQFQDNVSVQPAQQNGDQLTCQQLTVVFSGDAGINPTTGQSSNPKPGTDPVLDPGELKIERLIAKGGEDRPSVITSVSRNTQIVAASIDFNLASKQVTLTSADRVSILRNNQQITARLIQYRFTDDGRIGDAVMQGPGTMNQPSEDGTNQVVLQWQNRLTIQEDQGKKVMSMDRAIVQMNMTTVRAEQMHLWMWEIPEHARNADRKRWRQEPAKLLASGLVTIRSPDLNGKCNQAAAFWPEPDTVHRVGYRPPVFQQSISSTGQSHNQLEQPENDLSWSVQPVSYQSTKSIEPQKQATEFTSHEVQLQMRGGNSRGQVDELTADGNVVVQQKRRLPSGLSESSLQIRGDKLRVLSQPGESIRLFVSSQPGSRASVHMKQLELQGNQIHLDQARNRLWIDGPGEMKMSGQQDGRSSFSNVGQTFSAKPTEIPRNQASQVSWQGGMVFDGQTIYFETDVVSDSQQVDQSDYSVTTIGSRSAALSITLDQRIDFNQVKSDEPDFQQGATDRAKPTRLIMVGQMNASEVAFPNNWKASDDPNIVAIVSKRDRHGRPESSQQIVAARAAFQIDSKDIRCTGPGTLIARQPATNNNRPGNGAQNGVQSQFSSTSNSGGQRVNFIKVDFGSTFTGNLESRDLRFTENVHTFFTDTDRWDTVPAESEIRKPNSRGIVLDCQDLQLAEWTPQGGKASVEMIATGNARIAGSSFNAVGERISYAQSTGRVIMQAPTRSNAEIWFNQPGQSSKGHLLAKSISYNVETGEYEVDLQQAEYSQHGPSRNRNRRLGR